MFINRMQPADTFSYFLDGEFVCYCKMAAVTPILCAHWTLYLPPLSKNEQCLIGGRRKWKETDFTSWKLSLTFYVPLYFSTTDKGAKLWQIFHVRCPSPKLQVYPRFLGVFLAASCESQEDKSTGSIHQVALITTVRSHDCLNYVLDTLHAGSAAAQTINKTRMWANCARSAAAGRLRCVY